MQELRLNNVMAGRATLINPVGLALPVYTMQTTKLSKKLASKIDGMGKDFWWGCEQGNHGLYLKAWDHQCLPKSRGGIGFQKSLAMNQALLAKGDWSLLDEEQSLCYKDFYPKPNVHPLEDLKKVADLLLENREWDISKLCTLFDQKMSNNIIKGGKSCGQGRDRWVWTKEPNVLERHKVLWWGLLSNALPIRALLAKRIHIEEGVDVEKLFLYASIMVDTVWRARNDKAVEFLVWSLPPNDWVKINYDVKVSCGSMCAVALASDHTKSVLWVATNMLNFSDPFIGEDVAYLLTMETAVLFQGSEGNLFELRS
uniref:Uncharacterized protein n=1 Tax=Cannabis sativa TaxID=3483 RepID=A0A803NQX3_CANSA